MIGIYSFIVREYLSMLYELCYLVGESKESELSQIKHEVMRIISEEGGKWQDPQVEEKRKMAYKIGKEIRGIYVAQQFKIEKDWEGEKEAKNQIESISKKLNLNHKILRFIIVKAEDVPELKVREEKDNLKKDFKKQIFGKKPELSKEKMLYEEKREVKEVKKEQQENQPAEVKAEEFKKEEGKSIDEKIDEILNI